jgi:hypothetical protein
MPRVWVLSLLVLGLATPVRPQSGGTPAVIPVEEAPYHLPVFRNELVTVLNVFIPPGRSSGYHRHSLDTIAVLISDAVRTNQTLGAEAIARAAQPRGAVTFTPYANAPIVHTVDLQGESPFHNLVVELNAPRPAGFAAGTRSGGYTQVLDNERVRAWRLVLEPGQAVPAITQGAPGIRIVVDGGELVESAAGRPDRGMAPRAGELYWQEPGATRGVRNVGTTRIELVELELK